MIDDKVMAIRDKNNTQTDDSSLWYKYTYQFYCGTCKSPER